MHKTTHSSELRIAAGLTLMLAAVGCQTPNVSKTEAPIAMQPPADEATELRAAPQSVAFYHNGAAQAWPTRWYYAPNPDNTTIENFVADPVMFLVQAASLPVTLVPDYPFRKVYYAGDVVPPSYNAMPPLPPEPLLSPTNPYPDPLSATPEPVAQPPLPIPEPTPPMILPPETAPMNKPHAGPASKSSPTMQAPTTRPAH